MAKVHVYYFGSNFNSSVWIHSRQVSAGASKNRNILVNSLVELLYMLNSSDNITCSEYLSNALHKQHKAQLCSTGHNLCSQAELLIKCKVML